MHFIIQLFILSIWIFFILFTAHEIYIFYKQLNHNDLSQLFKLLITFIKRPVFGFKKLQTSKYNIKKKGFELLRQC